MSNMTQAVEQTGGEGAAGLEDLSPEQRLRVEYLDKLQVRFDSWIWVGLFWLSGWVESCCCAGLCIVAGLVCVTFEG